MLRGICCHDGMKKEFNESIIDPQHELKYCKFDWNIQLEDIPCTCTTNFAAKRVLPDKGSGQKNIVVYNNCQRTLFAAMKRQLKLTASPDDSVIVRFQRWFDTKFERDFNFLHNFNYSYKQWYEHIDANKQEEIDKFLSLSNEQMDMTLGRVTIFEMFCKREKQIIESYDKMPKNRAISGAQVKMKHVMGPVCWALEKYCSRNLKGYVVGTNWSEKEIKLTKYYKSGLKYTIQGDGSAFDTTQNNGLKYVDHKIYNRLVELGKIHHVDPNIFKSTACELKRKYVGYVCGRDVGREILFDANLYGTVGSGAPDTTLMNTIRMIYYNRFVMEELIGLHEDEYELWASGDDFVCFVSDPNFDYASYYNIIFSPPSADFKVVKNHGLGMVLKFLKIGLYEDIDFCSTHVVCDYRNESFKIVRQLNRVNPLCFWSDTAHHYNNYELKMYYKALADSFTAWCGTMPYYTALRDLFLHLYTSQTYSKHDYRIAIKKMNSVLCRKTIVWPNDGPELPFEQCGDPNSYYFLRKDNYTFGDRVSNLDFNQAVYYDFFLKKYSLARVDIDKAAREIGVRTAVDTISQQMLVT